MEAVLGMPMVQKSKSAWILGGTISIIAAATLAGCASTLLADSGNVEKAGVSKDIDDSISESRPNADVCRVLRDALADLKDAGISFNIFSLFGPTFVRTAK